MAGVSGYSSSKFLIPGSSLYNLNCFAIEPHTTIAQEE